MKTTYEAKGNVCGSCGHKHRTILAALRCAYGHGRLVRGVYGRNSYSDRTVQRTDGERFSEAEEAEYFDAQGIAQNFGQ